MPNLFDVGLEQHKRNHRWFHIRFKNVSICYTRRRKIKQQSTSIRYLSKKTNTPEVISWMRDNTEVGYHEKKTMPTKIRINPERLPLP
jgi:hypothetical protein